MKLYLFSWIDQTWMVLAPSTQRAGEILIEDSQFAYLWNKGESFDVKELEGEGMVLSYRGGPSYGLFSAVPSKLFGWEPEEGDK